MGAKAITLWEPWASAHAAGLKTIETRSWLTKYRGELVVHAGRGGPRDPAMVKLARSLREKARELLGRSLPEHPGMFVSVCRLDDCVRVEDVREKLDPVELAFGDYSDGRWAWMLSCISVLDLQVSARGKQGLWNWTGGIPNSRMVCYPGRPYPRLQAWRSRYDRWAHPRAARRGVLGVDAGGAFETVRCPVCGLELREEELE